MLPTLVIVLGSVPILILSRRTLGKPRTHGFYRFFLLELLLVIIVVNAREWFADPFGPRQLCSWMLLTASTVLALHAFRLFCLVGRLDTVPDDETNLPFENTAQLVTAGAYRYIRHPMYASLLGVTWGAALKSIDAASLVLAALATGFAFATAAAEERENIARFGDDYRAYMQQTRRFIPWLL